MSTPKVIYIPRSKLKRLILDIPPNTRKKSHFIQFILSFSLPSRKKERNSIEGRMIGIWNKFLYIEEEKRNDKKSFEQRNRFSIKSLFLSVGGLLSFLGKSQLLPKEGNHKHRFIRLHDFIVFFRFFNSLPIGKRTKGKRKQQKPKSKSFVSSANRQSSFASCMSARHSKERRRENNRHPSESRRNFFGEGEMKFNVRKLE